MQLRRLSPHPNTFVTWTLADIQIRLTSKRERKEFVDEYEV